MKSDRNTPFTREQVKELPKGFTPSKFINRRTLKGLISGKLSFDPLKGLYNTPSMNTRKSTKGRKALRSKLFSRTLPVIKKQTQNDTQSDK